MRIRLGRVRAVRLALVLLLVSTGIVRANQPWWNYTDVVTERHKRWSYVPLLSYHAGGSTEDDGVVQSLGLHMRWRYGVSREGTSPARKEPIRLLVFGLGIETDRFATVEPAAAIGLQALPRACPCFGNPVWLGLKLEVAAGYRWADDEQAPFASVKVGLGAVFTETVYVNTPQFRISQQRFRSEADLIVKAQVDLDGRWVFVGGLELDPLRLLQDFRATFH